MTVPATRKSFPTITAAALLSGGLVLGGGAARAAQGGSPGNVPQSTASQGAAIKNAARGISDAQVEANVLKALAGAPELAAEDIQSSTVYGVVTLSGAVPTETKRSLAENLAARAQGVKKVVDELTLGTSASAADGTSAEPGEGATAPEAGSGAEANAAGPDGPMPRRRLPGEEGSTQTTPPGEQTSASPDGYAAPDEAGQNRAPAYPQGAPAPPSEPPAYGSSGSPTGAYGSVPPPPSGPYNDSSGSNAGGAPPYGSLPAPGHQQEAYGPSPQPYGPPAAYERQGSQPAQLPVTIPGGAILRVRVFQGLGSNYATPGMPFQGIILADVPAGGVIGIPRGAAVQGVVVDARRAGTFKGAGRLALQLTAVNLGGVAYPLSSTVWQAQGADKSVRTVNSAVGLGALGAILGGVAGGGGGAALGAGVGAGIGVAGAGASPAGQVMVSPEAVLTFHLAAPAAIRTVSTAEMQRLAYAAGPAGAGRPVVLRRRYPSPYYGPVPYPYMVRRTPYPYGY